MTREQVVATSIIQSVQRSEEDDSRRLKLHQSIRLFFVLRRLRLVRYRRHVFQQLRHKWHVAEDEYHSSFNQETDLQPIGSMGYSGSTFFKTGDGNYLVKSVPRHFEYTFFQNDLLEPYAEHMLANLDSLLVRIVDFLAAESTTLGGVLGLVPTHHIIMENLLYGQDQAERSDSEDWQTWDLKPDSYFFPERDIAGGRLSSEATKSKLADRFEDKILLTQSQADRFIANLEKDTKLLEESNAVDYSLFLVRIPAKPQENPFDDPPMTTEPTEDVAPQPPDNSPLVPPGPPTWRTGIKSRDGKYVFRAAVLDFFWAKHKAQPKFMTFLINAWNLVDRQGPMSITTTPEEYRNRFVNMCRSMVEVGV